MLKRIAFASIETVLLFACALIGRAWRGRARRWRSPGGQRVLVLAPHPDDEAAGCAGALALHRRRGDSVCVVYVSDGRRSRAGGLAADAMAAQRAHEAAVCAARIGAAPVWLGLREGEWRDEELADMLGPILARFRPHLIYAPSRVDFHPEHWRVARAVAQVLIADCRLQIAEGAISPLVRAYAVQVPLTPLLANVVAPVDLALVRGALAAHASQWGSLERTLRMRRYAGALHGLAAPAEEFWELSAAQFCALHRAPLTAWPSAFRSLRPRPLSDPLAFLYGLRERQRLLAGLRQGDKERGRQGEGETRRQGEGEGVSPHALRLTPHAFFCPDCRHPLTPSPPHPLTPSYHCACGLTFEYRDGVLRLLGRTFGRELRAFTAVFSAIRQQQGKRLMQPEAYPLLPGGPATRGEHEWRLRRYDLALARSLLRGRPPQRVLDVGAWNGWLSNRLARDGHHVTAVDYFDDPHDGLGARQFYDGKWQAIQLDITDLGVLNQRYDLVIVNRCLQFAGDPLAFALHARERVAPGGMLLLTGLPLFRDPHQKAVEVARLQQAHRARYGVELFLRPTKGYLDMGDARSLRAEGIALRPYWQLRLANLRALISPRRPLHCYGLWTSDGLSEPG